MRPRILLKIYDNTGRRIFTRTLYCSEDTDDVALIANGDSMVENAELNGAKVDDD